MPILTLTEDSYLKSQPKQSHLLTAEQKRFVAKGRQFAIYEDEQVNGDQVKVKFASTLSGWNYGYFWQPAVEIFGTQKDNNPTEAEVTPAKPKDRGILLNVPGVGQVWSKDPILGGNGNFKWYEAVRADGSRVPSHVGIVDDMKRMAQVMEWVREWCGGKPIIITSWYRPPHINRAVGGSTRSQHMLTGASVDFYVVGMSVEEAYRKIKAKWGRRGGIARKVGSFIHLDLRGYYASWLY